MAKTDEPVDAGHPNYDDVFGGDDFSPVGGSGEGITFDSLLGVPVVITNAELRASTQANAKEGDQFAVIYGRVLDDVIAVELKSTGEKEPAAFGDAFSTSTGSYRVVGLIRQLLKKGALGKAVVRPSKVPGDTSPGKKARMLNVVDKDDAVDLLKRLDAEFPAWRNDIGGEGE